MGNLPSRVGTGDHEQPLMAAVLQGMQELTMDVQDLKGVVYRSWEVTRGCSYVAKGIEYRKSYGQRCSECRGSRIRVGHVKNYVLAAMYMAYKADRENAPAKRERMEELVGKKLRGEDGKLDLANAIKLEELVAHLQVVQGAKKSYINIKMREGVGREIEELLEEAFARSGERQWDPPPGRKVQKELKDALREARRGRD